MRLFRANRRLFGAFTAWVFIAEALVGSQMPGHAVASVKDPVLGELIICSSRDSGPATGNPAPSQKKPQCPHCTQACSTHGASGAIPVALRSADLRERTASAEPLFPSAISSPPDYLSLKTSHPRAPPTPII